MSTLISPAAGVQSQASPAPAAALPTRQRRPGLIALALALILGCGAVGAWLWQQAGAKVPVLSVAVHLQVGDVIERSDLVTVEVAGGVTAVAAANVDSVVGQVAVVEVLPGTLLQRVMVADQVPWQPGTAHVGVAVTGSQVPADGVRPGNTVQVVQLPDAAATPAGSEPAAPAVIVDRAAVFAVREDPTQTGGWVCTLVVDAADAAQVAAVSGTDRVALILVEP